MTNCNEALEFNEKRNTGDEVAVSKNDALVWTSCGWMILSPTTSNIDGWMINNIKTSSVKTSR